jgi:DNA-binding response OmpR family regulator
MATQVLIIEDDPLISRLYEKIFTFEKFDVFMAADGDVMMPKLNGMQVLEKLKLDPETKSIPVVMLSNLAGENDIETALSKGAVKYIIKSDHDPKEVTDMVKEIITGYTRNDIPTS